jgi:bifunctional DNase/RNase
MIEMTIDSIRVSLMNYQRVVILKEKVSDRYLPIWIGPAEADAIAVKLQGVVVQRPLTHDLLGSTIENLGTTVNSIIVNDLKNDTFFANIVLDVDQIVSITKREKVFEKITKTERVLFQWGRSSYDLLFIREWRDSGKEYMEAKNEDEKAIFVLSNITGTDNWLIEEIHLDARPSDALALAVRTGVPIYADESVLDKAGILLDGETGKPIFDEKETTVGRHVLKVNDEEMKKKMSAFYDFINTLDLDDFDKRKS